MIIMSKDYYYRTRDDQSGLETCIVLRIRHDKTAKGIYQRHLNGKKIKRKTIEEIDGLC